MESFFAVLIEKALALLHATAPRTARRVGTGQVLDYSNVWKGLVKVTWLFPIGIALVNFYSPPIPSERWIAIALVVGFSALCLVLTLEVVQRQIVLTDSGISQKSAWSKPVTIAWKDVRDVQSKRSAEVVIQPKRGRNVRVNLWLSGMETFAETLERRLAHFPGIPVVAKVIRAYPAASG